MGLKFTHTIKNFLDVTLCGQIDGGFSVKPYRKPRSVKTTLMADFCHPPHVVKNVPVWELIRLKHSCSDTDTYRTVERGLKLIKSQKIP